MSFSRDVLKLDAEAAIGTITATIREQVTRHMHRRGAVVGVSGGIDSSVCAALSAKAFGSDNVLALFMPDRDSSPDSLRLAKLLTGTFRIPSVMEEITPMLEGSGCYRRQAEAIREVFPDYDDSWKSKISIPSILEADRLNILRLTVRSPKGEQRTERMPLHCYLQLVAATNMKQRTRKMLEYYHADRLNYAVCGTPNRLEYDQGFFVKNGDGSADFKPIAHLYKTQVYDLAHALGVPEEITSRTPTTDTYSLPQTQEEFYFALPYDKMDLCLYGHNHGVPPHEVAPSVGLAPDVVERVYRDIEAKRRGTKYLQLVPLLVEPIPEIQHEVAPGGGK
jgi:NAD+ synthase